MAVVRTLLASAVSVLVILALALIVQSSAATLGGVQGALTGGSAGVTHDAGSQRASALEPIVDAATGRVTAVDVIVTGAELGGLSGREARLVLLSATGASLVEVTGVIAAASGPTVGLTLEATQARLRFAVPIAPLRADVADWSVIITGISTVPAAGQSWSSAVTVGSGTLPVVTQELVPEVGSGTVLVHVDVQIQNANRACIDITIRGSSPTPQAWSLVLNYAAEPFAGARPIVGSNAVVLDDSGTRMTIVGRTGNGGFNAQNNNALLTDQQQLTVRACRNGG